MRLLETAKMHRNGSLNPRSYEVEIERITSEELRPRGFALIIRDLPDGEKRFVIRNVGTGEVCAIIDSSTG